MITILVCLKPIRGSCFANEDININEICMNPYDIPVLKSCIRIKKQMNNCRVICMSMGVEGAKKVLNKCIALGADQIILLNDSKFAASDTYATSYILSEAIKKIGNVDVIACGAKTLDGETGQVPVEIATRLKVKYIPHVEEILEVNEQHIVVKTVSCVKREKIRVSLPLVTIFNSFEPTEPEVNLFSLKRAQQQQLMIWGAEDLCTNDNMIGQGGSKTRVLNVKEATRGNKAKVIEGTDDEKCLYLHNIIVGNTI